MRSFPYPVINDNNKFHVIITLNNLNTEHANDVCVVSVYLVDHNLTSFLYLSLSLSLTPSLGTQNTAFNSKIRIESDLFVVCVLFLLFVHYPPPKTHILYSKCHFTQYSGIMQWKWTLIWTWTHSNLHECPQCQCLLIYVCICHSRNCTRCASWSTRCIHLVS